MNMRAEKGYELLLGAEKEPQARGHCACNCVENKLEKLVSQSNSSQAVNRDQLPSVAARPPQSMCLREKPKVGSVPVTGIPATTVLECPLCVHLCLASYCESLQCLLASLLAPPTPFTTLRQRELFKMQIWSPELRFPLTLPDATQSNLFIRQEYYLCFVNEKCEA